MNKWQAQTITETFKRICDMNGNTPWVAIGDFLDDWRRTPVERRRELVADPMAARIDLDKAIRHTLQRKGNLNG